MDYFATEKFLYKENMLPGIGLGHTGGLSELPSSGGILLLAPKIFVLRHIDNGCMELYLPPEN